jgi:hypothetical protein
LRGSISEMGNEAVKENRVAGNPQLNCPKQAVIVFDFYPAMIPISVELRKAKEIPNLATGEQTWAKK